MSIDDTKRKARTQALERRSHANEAALANPERDTGQELLGHFLDAVTPSPGIIVSGYWPVRGEIDVIPLLSHLHRQGHPCGLPVMVGRTKPLLFREWHPGLEMEEAGFAIPVPDENTPELAPDLLLAPLLAFDGEGHRLGYGGGYYDRTLAALRASGRGPVAVGVAYAAQQCDRIPHHDGDQPLDLVVTESGVVRPQGMRAEMPQGESS
jgi:5-formyltetrahydrofolate cyclo-ligase